MKKAAIIFFILSSLIFSEAVVGTGAGIIPDQINLEGQEDAFSIINPNDEDIEFNIKSEKVTCEPEKGTVAGKDLKKIRCRAKEFSSGEEIILVETKLKGDSGSVGVIPAVAIRAELGGEAKEKETGAPLNIQEKTKTENQSPEKEIEEGWRDGFEGMEAEIATIIMLIVAIISVMIYPEIKKMKEKRNPKKRESTSDLFASSISDAQDDRPSASAEASHDPLLKALSHAWQAQSQQTSPPRQSP